LGVFFLNLFVRMGETRGASKHRDGPRALQHDPAQASRAREGKETAHQLLTAQALIVAVGMASSVASARVNKTHELCVADAGAMDARIIHPAHTDGRTAEEIEESAQHRKISNLTMGKFEVVFARGNWTF
jgi:hypothetical protein